MISARGLTLKSRVTLWSVHRQAPGCQGLAPFLSPAWRSDGPESEGLTGALGRKEIEETPEDCDQCYPGSSSFLGIRDVPNNLILLHNKFVLLLLLLLIFMHPRTSAPRRVSLTLRVGLSTSIKAI